MQVGDEASDRVRLGRRASVSTAVKGAEVFDIVDVLDRKAAVGDYFRSFVAFWFIALSVMDRRLCYDFANARASLLVFLDFDSEQFLRLIY